AGKQGDGNHGTHGRHGKKREKKTGRRQKEGRPVVPFAPGLSPACHLLFLPLSLSFSSFSVASVCSVVVFGAPHAQRWRTFSDNAKMARLTFSSSSSTASISRLRSQLKRFSCAARSRLSSW